MGQRPRIHHPLAHHEKRQHRYQRRIGEALEYSRRIKKITAIGSRHRENLEEQEQHPHQRDGDVFHGQFLHRIEADGPDDEKQRHPDLYVRVDDKHDGSTVWFP